MENNQPEKENNKNDDQMRNYLANERTLLAWIRTGLNTFAVGCAIARFGGTSSPETSLISANVEKKTVISGLMLSLCGVICLLYGTWRFIETHRQIKHQHFSTGPTISGPITSVFLLTAALIAVLVIFFII